LSHLMRFPLRQFGACTRIVGGDGMKGRLPVQTKTGSSSLFTKLVPVYNGFLY
jgi:hypothetical protein